MRLALPLGLLGLLAIAVLILIYVLKPKYREKKVSSTYIWKLSMRYRKKKTPFWWLQNWLLFLLQLLILAILALMMAQPYALLPSESGEKIVILDASASMTATTGRSSRFDRAKEQIASLMEDTVPKDKFTLILAGDEASCLVRRSDSDGLIRQKLAEARCGASVSDWKGAVALAEEILSQNPAAEVFFYTDNGHDGSQNVNIIDMSAAEWNAAIESFDAQLQSGYYVFSAQIASYGKDAEIAVSLSVDGKTYAPKLAVCKEGEAAQIVWDSLSVADFSSAQLTLEAQDSFSSDNAFVLFNAEEEKFRIQYVSGAPYEILRAGLAAWGKGTVDVVTDLNDAASEGYDLYIYEGVAPTVPPADGAVWLLAPPQELSQSWGIAFDGIVGDRAQQLVFSGSSSRSEANRSVMKGVDAAAFFATRYSRAVAYPGFEPLMSYGSDPLLLTKNENGRKTAVFAYDFRYSNPICFDFPVLIANLCNYCLRPTLQSRLFTVGDEIEVSAKPDAAALTLTGPDGLEKTYTEFPVTFRAEKAGVYTVGQTLSSGKTAVTSCFVRVNAEEGKFYRASEPLHVPAAVAGPNADQSVGYDAKDLAVWFAAAVIVLLCVEWGVQSREQY